MPSRFPERVFYYGEDKPLPESTCLHAGPVSLVYEAGEIRYIKLGDREALRRIYVSVRDQNWATLLPEISNLKIDSSGQSFRISFEAEHRMDGVDFFWNGIISGSTDGSIKFSMDGHARSTFFRHRIGFCILHPIAGCAGQPILIEKTDGTKAEGNMPLYVSPKQPFVDIRAIRQKVDGVTTEIRFEGEVFEMEDQRNWTDGSYKTYCTPLALPAPVEVKKGERIFQTVTFTLKEGRLSVPIGQHTSTVSFTMHSSASTSLPQIGLGYAPDCDNLSAKQLSRLRQLNLSHLRVDLDLSSPAYKDIFHKASIDSIALGVPLHTALTISDNAGEELESLLVLMRDLKPDVSSWLIFHTTEPATSERWLKVAGPILRAFMPEVPIGGGTNAYFAELNRFRPPVEQLDLVCFSVNPQVHSRDNASMVEALEAQGWVVATVKQWTQRVPILVSPITLRPRFNPYAQNQVARTSPATLPSNVDPRQMSLFGAGWTLGSLKYLSENGARSLTYYEVQGWRGVMEAETGSPLPTQFRSIPGCVFPIYHVLADVNDFRGGRIIHSTSSDNLRVEGMALEADGRIRIMLANLTDRQQSVIVGGITNRVLVRILDSKNAEKAMRSPEELRAWPGDSVETISGSLHVDLSPYAIVRLDSTRHS